jgi:hypothetical protein
MTKFEMLPIIPIEPRKVFGSKGELEYFAITFEEHLLASMVHLHVRRTGEPEKPINERPYHSYLMADCPDFARVAICESKKKRRTQ